MEKENVFNQFINNNNKVNNETGEINSEPIKKEEPKKVNQIKKQDLAMIYADRTLAKITELTAKTGETFNARDKILATDIMVSSIQAIRQTQYTLEQIDFLGNNIESQIKRWAKLGVGKDDNLYTELRKNGKTGMVDIRIKPQYQTLEKLIIKYCSKKIFRFKTDVICEGDDFVTEFDFESGQDKVVKHEKNPKANPNALDNIIGAYKIAYVKEDDGKITQLLVEIDKNRIMRAFNSAQTKNVWNADTKKMVLKTVTWEMWNSEVIRPFMVFPDDVIANGNLDIVNESADVEFVNKDLKHKDIIDAKTEVVEKVGTGEEIDF